MVNFPSSDPNNVRDPECRALISRTTPAQLTNDERRTSNCVALLVPLDQIPSVFNLPPNNRLSIRIKIRGALRNDTRTNTVRQFPSANYDQLDDSLRFVVLNTPSAPPVEHTVSPIYPAEDPPYIPFPDLFLPHGPTGRSGASSVGQAHACEVPRGGRVALEDFSDREGSHGMHLVMWGMCWVGESWILEVGNWEYHMPRMRCVW